MLADFAFVHQFDERKGPMATRRDEEVLAPGRGEESLQSLVVIRHPVPAGQVERRLVPPHVREHARGRNEDRELELGLVRTVGDIQMVEAGSIHADVDGRAVRRPGRSLQGREMTQAVLGLGRPDAPGARLRVVHALELVGEEGGTAPVGQLVFEAARRRGRGPEHVLHALQVGLVLLLVGATAR